MLVVNSFSTSIHTGNARTLQVWYDKFMISTTVRLCISWKGSDNVGVEGDSVGVNLALVPTVLLLDLETKMASTVCGHLSVTFVASILILYELGN